MGQLKIAIIPVTPFQQNCAVLWDDETKLGAVIDPGGDVRRIQDVIAQNGVAVEKILLTHGHVDHAAGAAALAGALGVEVIGPDARDQFLLDDLAEAGRAFGIPGQPITPARYLVEGEEIAIAGRTFAVLHCPGHTPGHIVLVDVAQKFAIVGDVLFHGSIGRTDFPYGDTAALITAITTKLLPLGDDIAFICGHGPGSSFGAERRSNPFL
jgi:hydroxyacylglutathione hydrolase